MDEDTPITSAGPVRRRRRLYEASATDTAAQNTASAAPNATVEAAEEEDDEEVQMPSFLAKPLAAGTVLPSADISPKMARAALAALAQQNLEHTKEAERIVRDHVFWSITLGFIPLPWLDILTITGVQLNMLSRLCLYYKQPFSREIGSIHLAAVFGGVNTGFLGRMTIYTMGGFFPLLKFISLPAIAGTLTYAVGKVFIHHFELGGTFLNFDAEKMREHFLREQENAQQFVQDWAKAHDKSYT